MLDFNTHCLHLLWLKWAHLHTLPTAPTELERSCVLCRWLPVPKCRYWYTHLIEVKTHCSLCRGADHPGLPSCSTGSPMIRDPVPGALSHSQFPQPLKQHRQWHLHPLWDMLWGGCFWKYLGHPFHNANHSVPEPAFLNTPIPARFL